MSENKPKTGATPTVSEAYLADFRGYIRSSNTKTDGEIRDLIAAARDDPTTSRQTSALTTRTRRNTGPPM